MTLSADPVKTKTPLLAHSLSPCTSRTLCLCFFLSLPVSLCLPPFFSFYLYLSFSPDPLLCLCSCFSVLINLYLCVSLHLSGCLRVSLYVNVSVCLSLSVSRKLCVSGCPFCVTLCISVCFSIPLCVLSLSPRFPLSLSFFVWGLLTYYGHTQTHRRLRPQSYCH